MFRKKPAEPMTPEAAWDLRRAEMKPSSSIVGPGAFESGRWTYWDASARFNTYKPEDCIQLGSFCAISPEVAIFAGGNHNHHHVGQYPFSLMMSLTPEPEPQAVESVHIGSDVWIGARALLIGPLTVGDGAVIAAGSVVTRDVAPYDIVAGVPARPIAHRFSSEDVDTLLRLQWWEWPDDEIIAAEPQLRSVDVQGLEALYSSRQSYETDGSK